MLHTDSSNKSLAGRDALSLDKKQPALNAWMPEVLVVTAEATRALKVDGDALVAQSLWVRLEKRSRER